MSFGTNPAGRSYACSRLAEVRRGEADIQEVVSVGEKRSAEPSWIAIAACEALRVAYAPIILHCYTASDVEASGTGYSQTNAVRPFHPCNARDARSVRSPAACQYRFLQIIISVVI
ncbi:hypothetical protein DPEC_G00319920 [Dallia pectoralis]|uniref:Uncharacterized protein n=1 Tax=Dallia pectoralis TaxID=75939 RepID=A0ACC2FA08_DALPE|nr:hypothetical protein DPEC_G00319920 [Dallia pectoralis]